MKLILILKSVFWFFIVLFIISLCLNIWQITMIEDTYLGSDFLKAEILTGILDSILAILLGTFGVKLLNSFKKNNPDFYQISSNLKYIGYTFLTGVLIKTVLQITIQSRDMTGIYFKAINDFMLIGLLGFFLIAISMIIKKADFYKNENDLTI